MYDAMWFTFFWIYIICDFYFLDQLCFLIKALIVFRMSRQTLGSFNHWTLPFQRVSTRSWILESFQDCFDTWHSHHWACDFTGMKRPGMSVGWNSVVSKCETAVGRPRLFLEPAVHLERWAAEAATAPPMSFTALWEKVSFCSCKF